MAKDSSACWSLACAAQSRVARHNGLGRLAACKEQSQPLERAGRPPMPAVVDREARALKQPDQSVDREPSGAWGAESEFFRVRVLADLQKRAADLVELAAYLVDEVEPPRGQQYRPLRSLAVELQQPHTL